MPSQTVVVGSKVGLHARPASLLVKASSGSGLSVTVGKPGEKAVNAASLLSVLALGIQNGDTVQITVSDGASADALLAQLIEIVATDQDE
ncbi:MAG: HPr family phosphocarrier protein [Actinomycetes bacterium]